MPPARDASDPVRRSLRLRLLVTVVAALVPVAILSVVQGLDRLQRDNLEVRQRLVQAAYATASDEDNILSSGEKILRALAAQPEVRQSQANCGVVVRAAYEALSYSTNISRIDAQGNILCSAVPLQAATNVSDRDWWTSAQRQQNFFISKPILSPVVNRMVLAGVLPLYTSEGQFDGVMATGFDIQWLNFVLRVKDLPDGAVAAVFDDTGAVMASTNKDAATRLFETGVNFEAGTLHAALGPNDEKWSYATAPLLGNATFVGFAMPDSKLFAWTYIHVATDLLLPVLMLALASLAIWIATERQVIQWLEYLRRISVAYAHGHYAVRPSRLREAPREFKTLGETMSDMAEALQDRDQRLRDALTQKTVLIRETHHRVKNNLQIVMSLLSLQAGQLRDPAAQEALNQAQMRVNALALVHRTLHEIEDQETVDLKQLLDDLAHQVQAGLGAERHKLVLNLDVLPRRVTGDLAVPLTLFAVEALTNAFKHAFPNDGSGGWIRIALVPHEEGMLALTIDDNGVGSEAKAPSRGIGKRLIAAFAKQVGGTASVTPREGGGTRVLLIFPDPRVDGNDVTAQPVPAPVS